MNPAVSIKYSAVGSTAGISTFSANQVAFGASDVPMTSAEQMSAQGGPSVQVPVDLGGEVLIYNLPGAPTGIHLTGSVIADIFRGQITGWDAPAITALNRGVPIPALPITVVHRSDGSGTTYIFTDYLSRDDKKWASSLGVGRSINWPVG
jgi:phosphate ABC transporter phosphate-binding protein